MRPMSRTLKLAAVLAVFAALSACKKQHEAPAAAAPQPAPAGDFKGGIVTDVGGRGDQSFNDSALRGLELWAAGQKFSGTGYAPASAADVQASLPKEFSDLHVQVAPMKVTPLVLQSKSQEDYEPNLELL